MSDVGFIVVFVRAMSEGLRASLPAAVFSGLPSTLHAVVTGNDPLEPSAAAGSILLPKEERLGRLLVAAVPVHAVLSVAWSIALAKLLPRKSPIIEGTIAGLAIAAIDLGIMGRRHRRIRELEPLPQIADHVAFGILVSCSLPREREDPA